MRDWEPRTATVGQGQTAAVICAAPTVLIGLANSPAEAAQGAELILTSLPGPMSSAR